MGYPDQAVPRAQRGATTFHLNAPVTIRAIGLWSPSPAETVTFRLHKGWRLQGSNWEPGEEIAGSVGKARLADVGYYLLDLPRAITVEGDIAVSVEYSGVFVPYESSGNVVPAEHRSFAYGKGGWQDLALRDPPGAFFVKLYLARDPAQVATGQQPPAGGPAPVTTARPASK